MPVRISRFKKKYKVGQKVRSHGVIGRIGAVIRAHQAEAAPLDDVHPDEPLYLFINEAKQKRYWTDQQRLTKA